MKKVMFTCCLIFLFLLSPIVHAGNRVVVVPLGRSSVSDTVKASDFVELFSEGSPLPFGSFAFLEQKPDGTAGTAAYIVPPGKVLVLTMVHSYRMSTDGTLGFPYLFIKKKNVEGLFWRKALIENDTEPTMDFTLYFSPGIVIPSEYALYLNNVAESGNNMVLAQLYGYLLDDK